MPTVSVITPTYNRADVLTRAIDSVREQTFSDYEHLIVDDGSTDDTFETVVSYDDPRIRYFKLQSNQGASVALNRGVKAANGQFIAFLDSDDEFRKNRLAIIVSQLQAAPEGIGGIVTGFDAVRNGYTAYHPVPAGRIEFDHMADQNVIDGNSNTMYRASIFDDVGGFDPKLQSSVDYDFQLRVLEEYALWGIDDPLCRKHGTVSGIQDNPVKLQQGLERLTEKHGCQLTDRNLATRYRRLASACLQAGNDEEADRYFHWSIGLCPDETAHEHHRKIGRSYLQCDHRRRAQRHLLNALHLEPKDYRAAGLLLGSILPVGGQSIVKGLQRYHGRLVPGHVSR